MEFEIIDTYNPEKGLGKIGVDDDGEDIIIPDRDGISVYIDSVKNRKLIHAKDKGEWELVINKYINKTKKPQTGQYAMCYYFRTGEKNYNDLELFFCLIENINGDYAKCKLFGGQEFDPNYIIGTVSDVCIADIHPWIL